MTSDRRELAFELDFEFDLKLDLELDLDSRLCLSWSWSLSLSLCVSWSLCGLLQSLYEVFVNDFGTFEKPLGRPWETKEVFQLLAKILPSSCPWFSPDVSHRFPMSFQMLPRRFLEASQKFPKIPS